MLVQAYMLMYLVLSQSMCVPQNAVVFQSYGLAGRWLTGKDSHRQTMSYSQVFLAGVHTRAFDHLLSVRLAAVAHTGEAIKASANRELVALMPVLEWLSASMTCCE